MEPEEYLRSKGFKLRSAPGEWQTGCPFCDDKARHGGHLYVNREHGAWTCHRCGEKGSFYTLQVKLGDTPEPFHRDLAEKWMVWREVVEICQTALIEQPEALRYLKEERGLTAKTVGKYRLGWSPKDLIDELMLTDLEIRDIKAAGMMTEKSYPLFWDRVMIPYYQRDNVVTIRGKQIDGNVLQAKDTSIHLFGVDNLRGHEEVFICEGEFDAMLLDQYGFAACAVPGALNFQDHWQHWFEDVRRVFICLDADDAGRQGAFKIKSMLGAKSKIIEFNVPRGEKSTDVTEFFLRDGHKKSDFERLVAEVRGQRVFTFRDGLRERDELHTKNGIKLAWPELDYAIAPGLLPGQVLTLLAKTGAGKTAWVTQVIHNVSSWEPHDRETEGPGIPTLVLSLEQTRGEISERLERIGHLYNPWADEDQITTWYRRMRICDENKIPAEDIRALMEEFIDEVGEPPKITVVDYLGYWARSFKAKSKYEQVSDAVMELKLIAKQYQTAIIAPHQVSRAGARGQRLEMDFARDSGVVEETSDFVFAMYRPHDDPDDQQGDELFWKKRAEVRLEILKSRHGNVGKVIRMQWAPYSLALTDLGNEMGQRVAKEWMMYDKQMTYSDVLEVHRGRKYV